MNPWFYIVILVILYIYISYYYRYSNNPKILQSYEGEFNTQLLLEKQPIILMEVNQTLPELKKKHVKYLLPYSTAYIGKIWTRNPYKYLYIRPFEDTEIHLLPATKKLTKERVPSPEETLITLQVKPTQVIILPFHWYYYSEQKLEVLGVQDYISWLLP